ncbi:MAG: tail fiber domain-containing protein [Flavobacteriales bacterium]|nr:tail fiber domain-containing protein [Flavobacteriales bacterium]
MLTMWPLNAQVTTPANSGFSGDFVGWDNTVTNDPLMIRHDANQPIEFYTHGLQRMRLYPTGTINVNTYPGIPQNGYLGISNQPLFFTNTQGPFTRLHLADSTTNSPGVYAQQRGFRPWQRNGVTFTGNGDHGYVGQKYHFNSGGGLINDRTDMVVQWSNDLDGSFGPDILTFRFTTSPLAGTNTGARSYEGLEGMRLFPESHHSILVGIGDYQAESFVQGVDIQPEERLDILDRTIRLRDFVHPTLYRNDSLYRVLVADSTDGRVYWRPIDNFNGSDCTWTLQGPPGSNSSISTAYPANPGCPQMPQGVGIGLQLPKAKLDVHHEVFSELDRIAIRGTVVPNVQQDHFGMYGFCLPTGAAVGLNSYGVRGLSRNGRGTYGVSGRGELTTTQAALGGSVYGVHGVAVKSFNLGTGLVASVYGQAIVPDTSMANWWGGYFEGRGFLGASAWTYSDANLKTGIEELALEEALDLVLQLKPKRYAFAAAEMPYLSLPTGGQIGLLSQEVEAILPELVMDVERPAAIDSTGTETEPALTFKAMNYDGLIPVLVGAVQAQQQVIAQLQEQMAAMQEQVAACCAQDTDKAYQPGPMDGHGEVKKDPTLERLLRIDPNPFTDATTVRYTLERAGRMQLLVNSGDGKQLQVLHEGLASAGDHSYDWNTAQLAPGVYYVTLLLDGEPLVKRAVKVR